MRINLLTLLISLLVNSNCFSQAMIGYDMNEIRGQIKEVSWDYGRWGSNNDYKTMSFQDESLIVLYYFNDKEVCFSTAIMPKTQGALQGMIEKYNKKYVIIDDTHWKFYTSGGVLKCSLEITDKDVYYFYWTN